MNQPVNSPSVPELLSPEGANIILGQQPSDILAMPLEPTATTMFGPRGACLVSETGPLWVADTGHHRLLGWRQRPQSDEQPADWVIGQPDFHQEGQNAKGSPTSSTVSVPTGICACGEGLAVADGWNHRVLIWKQLPEDIMFRRILFSDKGIFATINRTEDIKKQRRIECTSPMVFYIKMGSYLWRIQATDGC